MTKSELITRILALESKKFSQDLYVTFLTDIGRKARLKDLQKLKKYDLLDIWTKLSRAELKGEF